MDYKLIPRYKCWKCGNYTLKDDCNIVYGKDRCECLDCAKVIQEQMKIINEKGG